MSRPLEQSEEYMLAAFLTGELPDHLRREIVTYLTTHEDARDMLAMAQQAMDTVETGDGASHTKVPDARLSHSGGRRIWLRPQQDDKAYWKMTAFFAGAVLILTIAVALVALNTSRIQDVLQEPQWLPTVSGEQVTLEWQAIEGASSYQLMRFDAELGEAAIIARTQDTRVALSDVDDTVNSSPVWILALSSEGTLLNRSEPVQLQRLP